jgi:hypothetical protein
MFVCPKPDECQMFCTYEKGPKSGRRRKYTPIDDVAHRISKLWGNGDGLVVRELYTRVQSETDVIP